MFGAWESILYELKGVTESVSFRQFVAKVWSSKAVANLRMGVRPGKQSSIERDLRTRVLRKAEEDFLVSQRLGATR